jgi:hypothetical protein
VELIERKTKTGDEVEDL